MLRKLALNFFIPLLTLHPTATLKELAQLARTYLRFCEAVFTEEPKDIAPPEMWRHAQGVSPPGYEVQSKMRAN